MIVLRAIGRFFARIGRWIRDTAWVQPLLIVGGIFAIIFAIPYITKWVQSWFSSGNAAESYYSKRELEWDGIEKEDSEVDGLFHYITNYESEKAANSKLYKKFGSKFFLSFVQKGCDGCEANYNGFKALQSNWDEYVTNAGDTLSEADKEFKLFSIFIDTESDDNDEVEKNYFKKYVNGEQSASRYNSVFEAFASVETNYTVNNNLETETKFAESVTSPTVLLFDFEFVTTWSKAESGSDAKGLYEHLVFGLSEMFFDVSSENLSGNNEKAKFMWECWTHKGAFSKDPSKNI